MKELPDLFDGSVDAVIFDLDGVITDTASVHARVWADLFDGYLADLHGPGFEPFTEGDYLAYIDGKPRYDGVASFLASRDISLPWGSPDDPPDAETVCGLGNRKNDLFRSVLASDGASVFPTSVTLLRALRSAGIATGCVSSSKNCRHVLDAVGLLDHFDDIVDGNDAADRSLPGKPAPDTYVDCASRLGVDVSRVAMVEDAVSGVASGAAGGFAHVIGLDRGAGRAALIENGASVVVDDLGVFMKSGA